MGKVKGRLDGQGEEEEEDKVERVGDILKMKLRSVLHQVLGKEEEEVED